VPIGNEEEVFVVDLDKENPIESLVSAAINGYNKGKLTH
jgi:hypothetical protein